MSNVWFISDLHIGHRAIVGYRINAFGIGVAGYTDSELIEEHDDRLAYNWDQKVTKDDTVWVLGDISSGTKSAQLYALDWIAQRKGKKRLITGNHDSPHPMHRDAHKWQAIYLDKAFISLEMAAKRRFMPPAGLTLPKGHKGHVTAFLSHFPYMAHWSAFVAEHPGEAKIRYPEWRLPDCGHYLIHGHVHSPDQFSVGGKQTFHTGIVARNTPKRVNQIHVGVDAWGLSPVSLDEVSSLIWKAETKCI